MTVQTGAVTRTYLAVGAPDNPSAGALAGRVRLFTRNHAAPACPRWLCQSWRIDGQQLGDRFGSAVALGDVLGGTAPEILIGAPGSDANGIDSGAAYLLIASNAAIRRRIVGDASGDSLGSSLAATGDFDHDGKQDYVLGAPLNDAAGGNAGRTYVFLSSGTTLLRSPSMGHDRDETNPGSGVDSDLASIFRNWGVCLAIGCAGDFNADGRVDALDIAAALVTR
jgi:hypothetical protein